MRRIILLLAPLLLATTLSAQTPLDLEVPQTSAPDVLIPVAGNTAGQNGTYFRSDISIINFRSVTQRVLLRWLPQGTNGSDISPVAIDIAPQSGFLSEDFVGNVLGRTGLGAIEVTGVDSANNFDAAAQLHVTSRIWTPQPQLSSTGTNSQTFPSIILGSAGSNQKWIFGVRRTDQYRLNGGVTNLSGTTQRFRFTVIANGLADSPIEIDVPARSMQQISLTGAATGAFQIVVQNLTATSTAWEAWASSIDNVTGDAWSEMAFPAPSTTIN